MKKTKKVPRPIRDRQEALEILRIARDLADRGWIKKGRESIHHMLIDCLERALYEHGHTGDNGRERGIVYSHRLTPAKYGHALAYVCRCTYKGNDPGTNSKRIRQLYNHQNTQIHSRDIYNALANAVRLAMKDLQERRAAQ